MVHGAQVRASGRERHAGRVDSRTRAAISLGLEQPSRPLFPQLVAAVSPEHAHIHTHTHTHTHTHMHTHMHTHTHTHTLLRAWGGQLWSAL